MKIRLSVIHVLSLCFILTIQAQTPDEKIEGLINRTDYFELNRQYALLKDSVRPAIGSLAKCLLDDAFNNPEEACKSIEYLCRNHQEIGFDNLLNMIALWGQNLIKLGKYGDAADLLSAQLNSTEVQTCAGAQVKSNLEYLNRRAAILRSCPKSEIVRPDKDCTVSMIRNNPDRDKRNLLSKINVKINGKQVEFIFDTGADAPLFISEEFAKEHGFKIMGDSILTSGVVAREYTKTGFIDSMEIGDIVCRNLWAIVSPRAEITYGDSVIARIDAVLGRYFMDAIGEIHIIPSKNEIVFPAHGSPAPKDGGNLVLIGGQPYVEAFSNGERLLFHFDTGGGRSLNSTYYRKHKEEIDTTCVKVSAGIGGFGGARRIPAYRLAELPLTIAGTDCTMSEMNVFTEDILVGGVGDGSLGMDFVEMFDKVVFNFRKMFVTCESKKTE
ncbi:MAG: retropepsin-like domain-containing protein [Prevotella sp.]|jgi:hypothetical protein|nr:retropepsin-like domain-containing protein [Prevotella sp.]